MKPRYSMSVALFAGIVLLVGACAAPAPTAAPAAAATQVGQAAQAAQEAKSAAALAGTEWQLESFFAGNAAVPAVPGTQPTLGFGPDRYLGFGGCDWFMGTYYIPKGDQLSIESPAKTSMGCVNEPKATEQQGTFLTMLHTVTNYAIQDRKLVLYTTGQQVLMTLVALDPVPFEGTTWELSFDYSTKTQMWVPALAGAPVTAVFDGKTVTGNAGCNDYSGQYQRDGDRFKVSALTSTKKTCAAPQGVMDQEQDYLAALQDAGWLQQTPRSIFLFKSDNTPLMAYHAVVKAAQ